MTAAIADVSDLFKEEIEGDRYLLDGEWKNLDTISYEISVKGRNQTESFDVKFTHRGPVLTSEILKNAQVLFGSKIPVHENFGNFSFVWSGT